VFQPPLTHLTGHTPAVVQAMVARPGVGAQFEGSQLFRGRVHASAVVAKMIFRPELAIQLMILTGIRNGRRGMISPRSVN
jgi:hypothetical protein